MSTDTPMDPDTKRKVAIGASIQDKSVWIFKCCRVSIGGCPSEKRTITSMKFHTTEADVAPDGSGPGLCGRVVAKELFTCRVQQRWVFPEALKILWTGVQMEEGGRQE